MTNASNPPSGRPSRLVPGALLLALGAAVLLTAWRMPRLLKPRARPAVVGESLPQSAWARSLAVSPDGRRLVVGRRDGLTELLDLNTGVVVWARPLSGAVMGVAFTPNGAGLLVGTTDAQNFGRVALLDACTGEELAGLWDAGCPILTVAVAPDWRGLAVLADGAYRHWDLAARQELGTVAPDLPVPRCIAVAPDCRTVAVASDRTDILLLHTGTGRVRERIPAGSYPCSALAFAPDGRSLAVATHDAAVRLWSRASGWQDCRPAGGELCIRLAFAPDGSALALTSNPWSRAGATGVKWQSLTPSRGRMGFLAAERNPWSLTFTPDGRSLVTGGVDGAVTLWDLASGTGRPLWPAAPAARKVGGEVTAEAD